jgi:hypothetical protein
VSERTTVPLTQTARIERVARAIYECRTSWPWHLATQETREQILREAHRAVDEWEGSRGR